MEIESRFCRLRVIRRIQKHPDNSLWTQLNSIKGQSRPQGFGRSKVSKVGILGAGMMGAGMGRFS